MAIYDANGNQLLAIYEASGNELDSGYDAEGNVIYTKSEPSPSLDDDEYLIKVMTYNVQYFSALNANEAMQAEIISKYEPDIIGFQEFNRAYSIPSLAQTLLADYSDIQLGVSIPNNLAMASKSVSFQNLTSRVYTQQNGEKRAWMKAYIPFHGINLCLMNTHLIVDDLDVRYAQMAEYVEKSADDEYVIMTGDFNIYAADTSSPAWINMYKPLVDAGYNLANCSDDNNFNWTYTNTSLQNKLISPDCLDNIITTSNIRIVRTYYDMTKYDYVTNQSIDHIPIICELAVKIPQS